MAIFSSKQGKKLEVHTKNMSPAGVRSLRILLSQIEFLMETSEEGEFFECSSELVKTMANLIKQAPFSTLMQSGDIPYGDQAVEYSLESLADELYQGSLIRYDN